MSAKINIAKVRNNVGSKEEFALSIGNDDVKLPEWKIAGNLDIRGSVDNKDGYLLLEGKVSGLLNGQCSRCLSEVEHKLDIDFSEKLLYQADQSRFSDWEFGEVEAEYTIYDGDIFDFTDLLVENIIDELPSKILCREDCQGLCPHCGHNLNEGQCDCVFEDIDPRLAILNKLYSD